MKSLQIGLLLLAAARTPAQTIEQIYSSYGTLIVTQFITAPFPHPSRSEGREYNNEFFPAAKHYSDSTVALFVPKGFRETEGVDFLVHFHGWRNTVAGTLQQFMLVQQLVASGKNVVLIVPEGPHNAPDSAGGKLEDPDGFKQFMNEVVVTLKQRGTLRQDFVIRNIVLSGHSGGYLVMSAIVNRGGLASHIKEVWLFDALYAQGDRFLAWSQQPGSRLLNIYTDTGGTRKRTEEMMATLKERGSNILATTDLQVTAQELRTNRYVFLHTDLGHNEVLETRKTFGEFLKTSCFEDRSED